MRAVRAPSDRLNGAQIWDTAGQERYRSLSPIYYRKAAAAVVCYDITSEASLEKAKSWVRELQRQAEPSIIIALTGNKTDLEDRREVKRADAEKYAKEEGLLYFETSAKTGAGVADVFMELGAFGRCAHLRRVAGPSAARKVPTDLPKAQQPRGAGGVSLNSNAATPGSNDSCAC